MRHLIVAACGATLALTATAASLAASFSGPPFLISEGNRFTPVTLQVYETADGDIAAVLARDETKDDVIESIYVKLFDANGAVKHDRTLVFRGQPTSDGPAEVSSAGATPLADGRLMVGYVDKRADVVGLYARTVTDGEIVGPESAIHTEPVATDPDSDPPRVSGFLLPLTSGGVAIWAYANRSFDEPAGANLISSSGEVSTAAIDLARRNNFVTDVSRYLDGFIVRYFNPKQKNRRNEFAQIFGQDGERVGQEKQLEQDTKYKVTQAVRTLGLADGSIVVLRKSRPGRLYEISAEVFDNNWMPKKARTVIATTPFNTPIGAEAVAGGDFLVGVTIPDSRGYADGLEIKRLSQSLQRKGAPVRITGITSPVIQQMLPRANGDVLMTYLWYTPDSRKAKFSGRFIKP